MNSNTNLIINARLNYNNLIQLYHGTENMMDKAKILKELREEHDVPYHVLAEELYEVERQLYRYIALNKLIPELQEMVEQGTLRRLKAYSLTGLSEDVQRSIYHQMKDHMRKTKHDEFMKVVALMAKEKKAKDEMNH